MPAKRLNVLQLGSPTGLFGAERWILALVRYLDKDRIRPIVSVIKDAPDLDPPLIEQAERLGVETKIFEAYGKMNLKSIGMLADYIQANNIHILHTHAYKQDIIGLFAAKKCGSIVVSTPHGWSKKADFKLWCYEMLNRAAFPFFNAVVPLSDELYQSLLRIPGMSSRLHLIKNGVDIAEIDEIESVAPELEEAKAKGKFLIGYIGQLIHRKGLDILLRALSSLRFGPWHLFIIGSGHQEEELKFLVRDLGIGEHVSFMGFRPDRLEFLKGLDCFVLPSRLEGIPRCLMEAGAMGVPIVASDIPGCRDIVKHKKTGLLFRSEDVTALKDCILMFMEDKELGHRLGRSAREFVAIHYSAQRMAREYEELYFRLYGM